jgi:hypothetical protein
MNNLPRYRLWLVKQTVFALPYDLLSTVYLVLFAQLKHALDVLLLPPGFFGRCESSDSSSSLLLLFLPVMRYRRHRAPARFLSSASCSLLQRRQRRSKAQAISEGIPERKDSSILLFGDASVYHPGAPSRSKPSARRVVKHSLTFVIVRCIWDGTRSLWRSECMRGNKRRAISHAGHH